MIPEEDPWEDEDDEDYPFCPECGGRAVLLGTLGNKTYYRCQDCGTQYLQGDDHVHADAR